MISRTGEGVDFDATGRAKARGSGSRWTLAGFLFLVGLAMTSRNPARAADPPVLDPKLDEVLTRLERRSDGLRDIRCEVRFVEEDASNLTTRTKRGTGSFLLGESETKFLIHFSESEVDGVVGKQEWYLFDGHWLSQALERLRQVTKQEVIEEGERIDLFDLERAPFPPPFGHRKSEILRHFDVSLVEPREGDPKNTDHLVCVTKADSPLRKRYDRLELFVRRDIHLPSKIVVTRNEGLEINTAEFPDLSERSINTGLGARDFARPSAWKGYEEIVEPLEGSR